MPNRIIAVEVDGELIDELSIWAEIASQSMDTAIEQAIISHLNNSLIAQSIEKYREANKSQDKLSIEQSS